MTFRDRKRGETLLQYRTNRKKEAAMEKLDNRNILWPTTRRRKYVWKKHGELV
jgi:hypothetical protein